MERDIDIDIDVDLDLPEIERRSCLTCRNCADLCPGCVPFFCVWKRVGAKCLVAGIGATSVPPLVALDNIERSKNGGEVVCPRWERR